jgi:hypothetical protein
MKSFLTLALVLALGAGCATQSAAPSADLLVDVLSGSERKAAFVPPSHNRFPDGQAPSTVVWLAPESAGHTDSGEIVSGFKFVSSRQEGGARIQVYALTNPKSFTTNQKVLKAVQIGDYTVQNGSQVAIDQMSALGVTPMTLRVSPYANS